MDIEAGGKKMGTARAPSDREDQPLTAFLCPASFLTLAPPGPPPSPQQIQFELFMKDCPKTAENFRQLCTGEAGKSKATGKPLDYTGLTFHRIIPGFMAQGGDPRGDGSGGESIYGPTFRDENFTYKNKAGYLSMANSGPHTNGSQFFVLFKDQPHLDNKHVVFGRVFRGMDTLREIERFGTRDGAPKEKVVISRCGEARLRRRRFGRPLRCVAAAFVTVVASLLAHDLRGAP